MDDQQQKKLIASIIMFNCNDGISPHSTSEFMFEMMPMDAILLKYKREDISFLDAIYNFLETQSLKFAIGYDFSYKGDDTVHMMTSMNWISEIFGAHIMNHRSKYRHEINRKAFDN
ncbi:hypothetical protein C1645_818358 [Glomus cerebriforme]|uniref:Uncharacterized protein n=1 Tax=Glomus cerebriforme TaxID=658196 RepID=A0A397T7M7_9GLOM|nr:hypothetical protein C1645_818358 [Glomus cerebriforme]